MSPPSNKKNNNSIKVTKIFLFMLFVLPLLSKSATWAEIEKFTDVDYEMSTHVFDPKLLPHVSQTPKLYQNENIKQKINDDVPFVGIVKCKFDSIKDVKDGIIELKGTSLKIESTKFTNIEKTLAIKLNSCDEVDIKDVEFEGFTNCGAISMIYCSAVTINETEFTNFRGADQLFNDSIIIINNCVNVYFVSTVFSHNDVISSLIAISKTSQLMFEACEFEQNTIVYPGCVFSCSCEGIVIQNTAFLKNTGKTHSVAVLSINSGISIIHCFFDSNKIEALEKLPAIVEALPIAKGAVAVTLFCPYNVEYLHHSTILKDVCFKNTGSIPKSNSNFFTIEAIDMYADGSKVGYDGSIESTGDNEKQFFLACNPTNVLKGLKFLSYDFMEKEPFFPFIDHGHKPLLPDLRGKKVSVYYRKSAVKVDAPLGFFAIDHCVFEDSLILSVDDPDSASLISINMNHGGAVSVVNTIVEDNIVASSIIDIVNAKSCSISECTFAYNTAKHSSVALIVNTEEVRICGNAIEKNNALIHGAIALYNCSDVLVIQTIFQKNTGFYGCSSLIVQDSNVKVYDTFFLKNNMDFELTNLPEGIYDDQLPKILLNHTKIPGVTTQRNISAAIAAYGKSSLNLKNVAFSDSENEAEKNNDRNITISAIDGYAENTVDIKTKSVCTDTANKAFVGNWDVQFNDDLCEVGPYMRHIEVYSPIYVNVTRYNIVKEDKKYTIQEFLAPGVRYDPVNRVDCPVSLDNYIDEDEEEEGLVPEPEIQDSSRTAIIICACFIVFTLAILIVTAIYFCRQPPEDLLDDEEDDQRKTGLLDDEDDENDGLGI